MNRTNITPLRPTPRRLVAQVFSGVVEQTQRQVETLGDEGSEGRGQPVIVVPIEHLEIEWVGGHHTLVDNFAETVGPILRQRRHGQARTDHRVGKEGQVPARCTHGGNPPTIQRAKDMEHLEGLHERFQRVDPRHAEPIEEVTHQGVGTSERRRMGDYDLLSDIRPAGFDCDNRFAKIAGDVDRLLEGLRIGHRFEIEPQCRDPFLTSKHEDRVLELEFELVPQGHHVGNRQPTPLHRKVECHVGGHRNDSHPAVHPPAALLVGPDNRPIEIVEEPVTIRSDEGHVARRLEELFLELGPFLPRLGEARRVADGPAGAPGREITDNVDGEVAVDADIGGIWTSWKICNRTEDLSPPDLLLLGVDRPDFSLVPHAIALTDKLLGHAAAEYGDGARFQ